jgi:hypothetical protein
MWETIKNALISVKDATGIEIPGLPADLSSIGESATTAVQTVTESGTGLIDGAAPAIDAVTGGVASVSETAAGVSETAATAVDSATQALPDITGGLIGGSPQN